MDSSYWISNVSKSNAVLCSQYVNEFQNYIFSQIGNTPVAGVELFRPNKINPLSTKRILKSKGESVH